MAQVAEVWAKALPEIREGVTGVGIWAALNSATPVAMEGGVVVIGLEPRHSELAGHLRMAQSRRLMEQVIGKHLGSAVTLRVIEGVTPADWERAKRRDAESKRLQEQQETRQRAEVASKGGWEAIYEQLGRKFAAIQNKSLPQNRAKFMNEALDMVVETRKSLAERDDLAERNFARCIERVAQYAEVPSTLIASEVLKRAGEL